MRIIATTNRDLETEVAEGRFRADLYYRLSFMPIHVPPLRERRADIPVLAQHFVEASARRCKKPAPTIAPAALAALCRHAWPGNVRELENVIERAVIVARGEVIEDVDTFLARAVPRTGVDPSLPFREAKARVVEEFERAYVNAVLAAHGGKIGVAARHAELDPKNFSEKAARYGLRKNADGECQDRHDRRLDEAIVPVAGDGAD